MTPDDIRDLFRYSVWANGRVASSVESATGEQFTRHLGGSHPSIRDTWAHIAGVEWIWLERWLGRSPTQRPEWVESTDARTISVHLRDVETRRQAFLETLSEAKLQQPCAFVLLNGNAGSHALSDLLLHSANHSTFHRGQIVSMLRQVGIPPPSTDFIAFRSDSRA